MGDRSITETKFFRVVFNEISQADKGAEYGLTPSSAAPPSSLPVKEDWGGKSGDAGYIKSIISELERRRAFAVFCMTPEKISRLGAGKLSRLISDLSSLIDNFNKVVTRLETDKDKRRKGGNKLSDDERKRIDNLLGAKGI